MTSPSQALSGPLASRIGALALEVFDLKDLQSAVSTPVLKARSAGFIVLAHAEIEYEIERACLRVAGLLRNAAEPATALIAWGLWAMRSDGDVSKLKRRVPLAELVLAYENAVQNNHGIKQTNLLNLLVPLGVDTASLTSDLLVLDEFGKRRGDLAHQPLSAWTSPDLPSTHTARASQAGYAADQVVAAVATRHSLIKPALRRPRRLHRAALARMFRGLATLLDA